MKKLLLWLLAFAMLLPLSGCVKDEPADTSAATADPTEESTAPDGSVKLIYPDGEGSTKSDYVIVYDINDADAAQKALLVRQTIQEICGVRLETHYNVEEPHEHEILIGKFAREERAATKAAKEKLGFANDFVLELLDKKIAMVYTDDNAFHQMINAFTEYWLIPNRLEDQTLSLSAKLNLNRVQYQALTPTWETVNLLDQTNGAFKIVYERDNEMQMEFARYLQTAIFQKHGVRLDVVSDGRVYPKEIVLGSTANRYQTKTTNLLLTQEFNDFVFSVSRDRLVLSSFGNDGLFRSVLWFIDNYVNPGSSGSVTVSRADGYSYEKEKGWSVPEGYASLYCKTFGTYHSQYDAFVYGTWGNGESMPQAAKEDQRMIQTLKARLGDAAVFYVGEALALYQKYYVPLNSEDYGQTARLNGSELCVPAELAKKLLGEGVTVTDGYVSLTASVNGSTDWTLYHYGSTPLYILIPKGVEGFADLDRAYADIDSRITATYTEKQFLDRLVKFFTDPIFDPDSVICNAEQSREVLAEYHYPLDVVDYVGYAFHAACSPSLLITEENGVKVYWTAHEKSTIIKAVAGQPEEAYTETVVMRRTENESQWTKIASVEEVRWGSLFHLNGDIYLLGSKRSDFSVAVSKIEKTATGWKTINLTVGLEGVGGCGPNTVLQDGGYIYKAWNNRIVYAPTDADLTRAGSWSISAQDIYDVITEDWLKEKTGKSAITVEEGEIVKRGDQLYVLYRFSGAKGAPLNHGVLAELVWEGENLNLKNPQYIEIPTTLTKFNVVYDEESELYYAVTSTHYASHDSARINLALIYSADLVNWKNAGNLLIDREMMNEHAAAQGHGYNYADCRIDGDKLVFAVREACGDTAQWWHEGNYFTLYTVDNFRDLIP